MTRNNVLRAFEYVRSLNRPTKVVISIAFDLVASLLVGIAVFRLGGRANFDPLHAAEVSGVAALTTVAMISLLGGYSAVVRFVSNAGLSVFAAPILAGTFAYLFLLSKSDDLHSPTGLVYLLGCMALILGSRFAFRRLQVLFDMNPGGQVGVVIYGAGEAGRKLATMLEQEPDRKPIAYIDDDKKLSGLSVGGLKVYDPDDLPMLIKRFNVREVVLAVPALNMNQRRRILAVLSAHSVKVQTVPSLSEILSGRAPLYDLRPVPIEELLGRERVAANTSLLKQNVEGKSVLVTGAGGSIGSELCRSIAALHPRALVLLDMSEHALFQIDHELRAKRQADGGDPAQGGIYAVLGSAEDELLVRQVLKSYDVETVFHAAAYKHVPLVELNVVEGVRNNVLCTKVLLQAIQESNVSTFVMVSSDKAVRPTSVMGASKRVAELLVQAAAARTERCKMSIVRFGNVLESSGSVIPLFRTQMANGGPLTVTHPEVTRFFMTIPEAAELVIQAGALGGHGEVFHLDMGKPIRILDLAKQFLKLHGLRPRIQGEDGDIEIKFIGLRPGEKLYEELLLDETAEPTVHPRIFCAHERFIPMEELTPLITRLIAACVARDETVTISLLRRVVEGFGAAEPADAAMARAAANAKPVLVAANERRTK